jgi:hypothetical protein
MRARYAQVAVVGAFKLPEDEMVIVTQNVENDVAYE